MKRDRRDGFTLLELLVVVSVIVILVAILIPSLEFAFARSAQARCASNLRQLGAGVLSYGSDSQGVIPPVSSAGDTLSKKYAPRWFVQEDPSATANDVVIWNLGFLWYKDTSPTGRIVPATDNDDGYIREPRVYFCPSQAHEDLMLETYSTPNATYTSFPIPVNPNFEKPAADEKSGVRLPYYYNPVMADPANAAGPVPLFQRVSELTGKQDSSSASDKTLWAGLLVLDTVELNPDAAGPKFRTIAHAEDTKSAVPVGGWNAVFGDGSTRFVADKRDATTGKTILQQIDEATDLIMLQEVYRRISRE